MRLSGAGRLLSHHYLHVRNQIPDRLGSEIPEGLPNLLRHCIPNIDAAELLLRLAHDPDRTFRVSDLTAELKPAEITPSAARKHLAALERCGLIVQHRGRYQFAPRNSQLYDLVRALGKLYAERPVTLVRMIYTLRDEGPHAFAETFTLKKP